jgi:putative phosphoribosyl transferase
MNSPVSSAMTETRGQPPHAGQAGPVHSERSGSVTAAAADSRIGPAATPTQKALRGSSAERIVLAVPVAPRDTLEALHDDADEVVCLSAPANFRAVGLHYANFEQTSDAEVVRCLKAARAWLPPPQ